jgi:hypothetical protein
MQQQQAALLHRPRVEEHLIGRGVCNHCGVCNKFISW